MKNLQAAEQARLELEAWENRALWWSFCKR